MIPVAAGARIWWIASGRTDMRKVTNGLALLMQEGLGRDPLAGDVFVFRDRAGSLIKALWHDNDDGETRRGPQAPGQQNAATDSRTICSRATIMHSLSTGRPQRIGDRP